MIVTYTFKYKYKKIKKNTTMYGLRTLTLHWTLVKDTTLKLNYLYKSGKSPLKSNHNV